MGFLSGLQGLFDPSRLAAAQAFASGDYQGAAALRARLDELQRQRDMRDDQVIGAKDLGFNADEIGAMTPQDLSRLAQERALQRMFGSDGGYAADGKMPAPTDSAAPPGPADIMPEPEIGPGPPSSYGAPDASQVPIGPFDPSFFAGGDPGGGQLANTYLGRAKPTAYSQPPFGSDQSFSPLDRKAAVQQAAAAIRSGADPKAVRARLSQVGTDNSGFDPSDPFSNLVPGVAQVSGTMDPTGVAQQDMLPAVQPLSARDSLSGRYDLDPAAAEAGGGGAPAPDRAAAIQHAADAIQRGADPNAVHALLIQMGQGDQERPSPFAYLIPKGGSAKTGDAAQPAMEAQPSVDDQGGFARPTSGASFAQDPLGRLPPRLDPRLAPQKSDDFAKHLQTFVARPRLDRAGATDPTIGDSVIRPLAGIKPSSPTATSHFRAVLTPRGPGAQRRPIVDVNGFGYAPPAGDFNLLQRALFAEFSTVNNWRDMVPGAWSMVNRVRPNGHWPGYRTRFTLGTSLADVLTKRLQYSFMAPGGIGVPGGSRQWQRSAHPETLDGADRQAWLLAGRVAQGVLNGTIPDPTGGATHFFNRSVDPDYFRRATTGPHATLEPSPYRSPTGENLFFRTLEDKRRPAPYHPGPLHLRVQGPPLNVSGQGIVGSIFP